MNNNKNQNKYPIGQELIFGEELNSYMPIPGEEHYSVMESDPFYTVRVMATNITRIVYGEPRLVQLIVGVYKDLVEARKLQGYQGVRGLNMKGIVTACLYLIILYEEKTRLSLDILVRAANSVSGHSKVKVTEKMVNRYIKIIADTLKTYRPGNSNSNNDNNSNDEKTILKHVDDEIKRLVLKLQQNPKDIRAIRASVRAYPRNVLTNHIPRTIAAMAVFSYVTRGKNTSEALKNKKLLQDIGITKPILQKMVHKIKNISII
jgi:hypothetical protein